MRYRIKSLIEIADFFDTRAATAETGAGRVSQREAATWRAAAEILRQTDIEIETEEPES